MKLLFKSTLIAFLLFEIAFSFIRYTHFTTDGDLVSITLPNRSYNTVLTDPFALNVLLHDSIYAAPNRYFVHRAMVSYFNSVPLLLQAFVSPIDSIYYSCALAKTLIHFFIVFLLAVYCTGKWNLKDTNFLLAAALITPLIQTFGFNQLMGIIDHSISYTFFYAFSLSLVLLFFLPIFLKRIYGKKIPAIVNVVLIFLAIIIAFSGPLNPVVVILICTLLFFDAFISDYRENSSPNWYKKISDSIRSLPTDYWLVYGFATLLCLYSVFVGRNNAENFWESIPILERYSRLPTGIFHQFTFKIGMPLLVLMSVINALIIKKRFLTVLGKKLLHFLKWIFILSLIYLALLPLGGYRSYRFYILRSDTQMPITLSFMLFYGVSTFFILKNITSGKKIYYAALIIFTLIYLNADTSIKYENNNERKALETISASKDKIVLVESDCTVLSWIIIGDYNDSREKAVMLKRWGVIKEMKYYYQK